MYKAGITLIVLANLAIWFAVICAPSNNLKVVFCDVGQGDGAILMVGLTQIVIDGGPDDIISSCLSRFMPFFDRQIEIILMTHPQADHAVGLSRVLDSYSVIRFISDPEKNDTQGFNDIVDRLRKRNILPTNMYAGDKIIIGKLKLNVIWPTREFVASHIPEESEKVYSMANVLGLATDGTDLNSFGIVLEVNYGDLDVLFTADTDIQVQNDQLNTGLIRDIDILKVPHHGSKTGMLDSWLDVVNPELAVISVGKNNKYGHPTKEALQLLSNEDIKTLRTDIGGNVVIETDGKRWWVIE